MNNSLDNKYCVDCRYCQSSHDQRHRCKHRSMVENDVITGRELFRTCEHARCGSGKCGLDGALWEERKPLGTALLDTLAEFYAKHVLKL